MCNNRCISYLYILIVLAKNAYIRKKANTGGKF